MARYDLMFLSQKSTQPRSIAEMTHFRRAASIPYLA
jgi:hypothetical protein